MRPFSRGTTPIEYSIRMCCEPSLQFSFGQDESKYEFVLNGVRCGAELNNGCLLVTATGLPSKEAAVDFFGVLQRHTAALAVKDRLAISIPPTIRAPELSFVSFIAEDFRCIELGWPARPIQPLMIGNQGAWWYPEHEHVAIHEAIRVVPTTQYSVSQFAEGMRASPASLGQGAPLREELALAVAAYGQVKRSTQAVWSFLLTVMVLEMLSSETKSNVATLDAVETLVNEAKVRFEDEAGVDLERIRTCLNFARTESITTALKKLIRRYCCPGIASQAPSDLFVDVKDCDKKVAAIYRMRSQYIHEGRIQTKLPYNFVELHSIAVHALGHILACMLREPEHLTSIGGGHCADRDLPAEPVSG